MNSQRTIAVEEDLRRCIHECDDCHDACAAAVSHCLEMGGRHAAAAHIRLLLDCAEICRTAAGFMLRGSDLHRLTCGVCAQVCERCAASCEALRADDTMRACAEECRLCAASCREMAAG